MSDKTLVSVYRSRRYRWWPDVKEDYVYSFDPISTRTFVETVISGYVPGSSTPWAQVLVSEKACVRGTCHGEVIYGVSAEFGHAGLPPLGLVMYAHLKIDPARATLIAGGPEVRL